MPDPEVERTRVHGGLYGQEPVDDVGVHEPIGALGAHGRSALSACGEVGRPVGRPGLPAEAATALDYRSCLYASSRDLLRCATPSLSARETQHRFT
jgi:hypothetical protein